MLLSEAIEWVRTIRPTWQPTAKGYPTHVVNANHVLTALGDIPVTDLNAMSFVRIQQHMKQQGSNNATINRVCSVLSVVCKQCLKHQILSQPVPYDALSESKGRDKTYTQEQVNALLEAARGLSEHDGDVVFGCIWLATKTGAREGELLNLRFEHIDWDRNQLVFYDTKVQSEDRVLPMTPEIRGYLKYLYRNRIDDVVFPITADTLLRRVRKCQRIAGIDDTDLCFHSFRHFTASELFARGASLPEVMDVCGWRNPKTALRYSHTSDERKQRALQLL